MTNFSRDGGDNTLSMGRKRVGEETPRHNCNMLFYKVLFQKLSWALESVLKAGTHKNSGKKIVLFCGRLDPMSASKPAQFLTG